MIPIGNYMAKAVEWDFGTSGTGKEQIAVLFELSQGEHAGSRMTWHGYFHDEGARKRTFKALRAAGWKGQDLYALEGLGSIDAQIVVEHETYEGKLKAKIAWVNAAIGLALKDRMTDEQKRAFAAKMRGEIALHGGQEVAAPPAAASSSSTPKAAAAAPARPMPAPNGGARPAPAPPAGRFDDDEIPF